MANNVFSENTQHTIKAGDKGTAQQFLIKDWLKVMAAETLKHLHVVRIQV